MSTSETNDWGDITGASHTDEITSLYMSNTGTENNLFLLDSGGCIELENPHPLFNVEIIENYEAFHSKLKQMSAEKTFKNSYDDEDILFFKMRKALSTGFEQHDQFDQCIEYAFNTIEHTSEYETFTEFTTDWFSILINQYNKLLHKQSQSELLDLQNNALELVKNHDIDEKTVVSAIAESLNVNINSVESNRVENTHETPY